jgi:DNA-binding response OmpR family regulator
MKKVLITDHLEQLYAKTGSFLNRAHIKVFTAATNDEVLKIHREEKVDLIVARLDLPGIGSEELFDSIRQNKELREVSTILICKDTLANRERCRQCGANAVFTLPVDLSLLHAKVQQLLEVAPRKSYRVTLTVAVEGKFKDVPLMFRTENISASGMLIRADNTLAEGDHISFSFFLPDETHVVARGEIARVIQQAGEPDLRLYGVRFTDIDPNVRSAIEAIVRKEQERAHARLPHPDLEAGLAPLKKTA